MTPSGPSRHEQDRLTTSPASDPASLSPYQDRPATIPWPPLLVVSCAAAAVILSNYWPLPWPGTNDLAARSIGLAIGLGGIILAAWAAWTLYREKTNILPHRPAQNLVTTGPFARLRNPIYVADVMILLGVAELTKNVWFVPAAAVFAILVTYLAIRPEERHLEARFGEAYRNYRARSRRWL